MLLKEFKRAIKKQVNFKLFKPKIKIELKNGSLYKITVLTV